MEIPIKLVKENLCLHSVFKLFCWEQRCSGIPSWESSFHWQKKFLLLSIKFFYIVRLYLLPSTKKKRWKTSIIITVVVPHSHQNLRSLQNVFLLFSHQSLPTLRLQHIRILCLPLSPGVCSSSCPLSQWCYLIKTCRCH